MLGRNQLRPGSTSGEGRQLVRRETREPPCLSYLQNCDRRRLPEQPSFESGTWAGFTGRFFNYGGYTDPNQDVSGTITLSPASKASGPFYVVASIDSQDGIVSGSQVLGTVSLGRTAKLSLKWDQANKQFIFRLNNDAPSAIGYSVPDTIPPFYAVKWLEVGYGVPECASAPLGSATIDAYFDDVYVNP